MTDLNPYRPPRQTVSTNRRPLFVLIVAAVLAFVVGVVTVTWLVDSSAPPVDAVSSAT
jgi:hypothetical protein